MAKVTLERLEQTDKEKYPANTLIDYYDAIKKLLEALNYVDGIKIKGEGAHQKVIDSICIRYGIEESKRIFLQNLREYRNRISYEGFNINNNYIMSNIDMIEDTILTLLTLLDTKNI